MAVRAVRRATFLSKAAALKAGNSGRVTVMVKSPQERATGLVVEGEEGAVGAGKAELLSIA
eukprot:scaffold26693_cov221-Amphora_coffeaeformis.AAC.1